MQTEVIAVVNQKGGVGKTTTTVNLAAALGELGRRVLIVDLDSSTSSTQALGVSADFLGSAEVMTGAERIEEVVVRHDPDDGIVLPPNVALVCGRRNLETIDVELDRLPRFKVASRSEALLEPLREVVEQKLYDYVLLDTAPNTATPTKAAYRAARWFLVACMPQPLAVAGITACLEDIADFRRYGNAGAEVLGIVLGHVETRPTLSGQRAIEDIRSAFPDSSGLFSPIRRSVVLHRAQAAGRTILQYESLHPVADDFRRLATEVEQRIAVRSTMNEEVGRAEA